MAHWTSLRLRRRSRSIMTPAPAWQGELQGARYNARPRRANATRPRQRVALPRSGARSQLLHLPHDFAQLAEHGGIGGKRVRGSELAVIPERTVLPALEPLPHGLGGLV